VAAVKKSMAAVTSVALGAVLAPQTAQADVLNNDHARQRIAPAHREASTQRRPALPQQGAGQAKADLEVCCGAGVIMGGALVLMAARRGKKSENELLSEDFDHARDSYQPGREDRRR